MIPTWLAALPLLVHVAITLSVTVSVILKRRPLPVSLTWIALCAFVPYIGGLLYLLIGDVRLGRRRLEAHRRYSESMRLHAAELLGARERAWNPEHPTYPHIAAYGTAVCGLPPLTGNHLEMLDTLDEFITALVAAIDAAEDHCHILTYIWIPHDEGLQVAEALIRASARGVTCRILVDNVGSASFLASDLRERLEHAGVQVVASLPVGVIRSLFERIDMRNHRKIAVIDGRIGFCGSHNITNATFGMHGRDPVGPWIDASIRIDGPAAEALQIIFLRDWNLDAEDPIREIDRYVPRLPVDGDRGAALQVLPSGPGAEPAAIEQAMLTAIYGARQRLIMTTPYFVPSDAMLSALVAAARRGVEVRIVVPRRNDSLLVAAAARSYFIDLLDAGAHVHLYRPGLLHAKTLSVDDEVALIGSANLDIRSFRLNFEVTTIIYDAPFAKVLRDLQDGYMHASDEIDPEAWHRRPLTRVFLDNTAQLLSPIL